MRFTALLLIFAVSINSAFATCDYAKDISENANGSFTYTRECHIEVGKKVRGFSLMETEIKELRKTIELKDLAIEKLEERSKLWMDTSVQMADKVRSYESARSFDNWLHFGLGVLVTGAAVYGASKLVRKD